MPSLTDRSLFEELTEAHGVPGYENRIREILRRELDPVVDELRTDAIGNVLGTIEGNSDFEVVVAAHIDEIGFMVRNVTEDGFLQLDPLGGWDPRVLKAQRVVVHAESGPLTGIIGAVPPHTLDEADLEKTPEVDDVYVDLGRSGDEVADLVSPGDTVTMAQSTTRVGDLVTGKALDNRASVYAMLIAARQIQDPDVTVHFAGTTQEELGLRGAIALANDLETDLAIALDVTVASDLPEVSEGDYVTELGEGTAIKLKDGSVVTTPAVTRRLQEIADDQSIEYQTEVLPSGGTDTGGLQRYGGPRPVGAVSIPTRYLHTVTESAHVGDIEATADLLAAALNAESGTGSYVE